MTDQRSGLAPLVSRAEATTVEVQHYRYAGGPIPTVVDVELAAPPLSVREVSDPHYVAPERWQRRDQNPTPRPACRRIVECGVSAKRPPDDHHQPEEYDERRDADDHAAHRIK